MPSIQWWEKTAKMNRKQLVEAFADETEKRQNLQAPTRPEQKFLIGHRFQNAQMAARRMGLSRWGFISTEDDPYRLRGLRLKPEQVYLVPGWTIGRYSDEIIRDLHITGVDHHSLAYVPSPEQDRLEGYSDWGRREAREIEELRHLLEIYTKRYGQEMKFYGLD